MSALPKHPVTGITAIGIGKRGPIWPVLGGSEDAPPDPTPGEVAKQGSGEFAPITSQAVLDHIIQDRLAREKAKYSDYEDLKKKAEAYDAAETEKLSEIQKAEKRAQDAEAEAEKLRVEKLRLEVAGIKGVPVALLSGSTKEEMEAAADTLLSWRGEVPDLGKPSTPKPNPQQGSPSSGKTSGRAAGAAEVAKRF